MDFYPTSNSQRNELLRASPSREGQYLCKELDQ
jgi:hypothetical protein